MALMETKLVQVANSPSSINSTNEEWGSFGWSVLSIQVTHSQDSKTYTAGLDYFTGNKTVETTTLNYATITYQRDKKMPNYAKICDLEREYSKGMNEMIDKISSIEHQDKKLSITINPFKMLKNNINMTKRILGVDSLSKKAAQESNELASKYQAKLSALRIQAESLLE